MIVPEYDPKIECISVNLQGNRGKFEVQQVGVMGRYFSWGKQEVSEKVLEFAKQHFIDIDFSIKGGPLLLKQIKEYSEAHPSVELTDIIKSIEWDTLCKTCSHNDEDIGEFLKNGKIDEAIDLFKNFDKYIKKEILTPEEIKDIKSYQLSGADKIFSWLISNGDVNNVLKLIEDMPTQNQEKFLYQLFSPRCQRDIDVNSLLEKTSGKSDLLQYIIAMCAVNNDYRKLTGDVWKSSTIEKCINGQSERIRNLLKFSIGNLNEKKNSEEIKALIAFLDKNEMSLSKNLLDVKNCLDENKILLAKVLGKVENKQEGKMFLKNLKDYVSNESTKMPLRFEKFIEIADIFRKIESVKSNSTQTLDVSAHNLGVAIQDLVDMNMIEEALHVFETFDQQMELSLKNNNMDPIAKANVNLNEIIKNSKVLTGKKLVMQLIAIKKEDKALRILEEILSTIDKDYPLYGLLTSMKSKLIKNLESKQTGRRGDDIHFFGFKKQ